MATNAVSQDLATTRASDPKNSIFLTWWGKRVEMGCGSGVSGGLECHVCWACKKRKDYVRVLVSATILFHRLGSDPRRTSVKASSMCV